MINPVHSNSKGNSAGSSPAAPAASHTEGPAKTKNSAFDAVVDQTAAQGQKPNQAHPSHSDAFKHQSGINPASPLQAKGLPVNSNPAPQPAAGANETQSPNVNKLI